jgi:hypothetical protein
LAPIIVAYVLEWTNPKQSPLQQISYRERILHHLAKKAEMMVAKLVQNEEANLNLT